MSQSILVCGSHKFDANALNVVGPLSSIDTIITDDGLVPEHYDSIRSLAARSNL